MKIQITLFLVLVSLAALSQTDDQVLDPVTVTGSIQPNHVSRTGRNILSFRGESFNQFPVQSLDELLRYLPGMEVQMRGPMGAQSDIVLRGGTFQQVLVLLDGLRVNDPNTGHFSSYIPIVPSEIERVEVLKGAASAIYGTDAVGGVVHIITKAFASRQQQKNTEWTAQVKGGEYNLLHAQLGGLYQDNNLLLTGGWLSNNTRGQMQRGNRGFLHNNTLSVSASKFINDKWQVSIRGGYDNRDFAAQNFYTTFLSDTATEQVSTLWTQARVEYRYAKHHLTLDAGFKKVKDDYLFNKSSIANANKSGMLQATIMDEYQHSRRTTLIGGVQFINKTIRSNDRGNHEVAQGGLFFLLRQNFGEYFTIHPAIRLEYNERSGTEWIPQMNLSYKRNKWQLRGSAGKTIRDADFTERFNNYNKAVASNGSRMGDPNLKAETSFSYEAGADYFFSHKLRFSTTFFQRHHRKLIDYIVTNYDDMPRKDNLIPGATYALAKNIATVKTTGVELDIHYNHKFSSTSSLFAGWGWVWLESNSSDASPSFYVSNHARWLTNFFAEYRLQKFLVSVNGVYKNRKSQQAPGINAETSKEYVVINMRLGYYAYKKKLQLFLQADNLLDRRYSDILGAPMPGRWISGGFSFTLKNEKPKYKYLVHVGDN